VDAARAFAAVESTTGRPIMHTLGITIEQGPGGESTIDALLACRQG
jgi:hypothetical protein